jgi:hypothetical protein
MTTILQLLKTHTATGLIPLRIITTQPISEK